MTERVGRNKKKAVFAAVIVVVLIVCVGGYFLFFHGKETPILDGDADFEISSVEVRTDEDGNNAQVEFSADQQEQIRACLSEYKKEKTWSKSGGFSGKDYDILITYSELSPDSNSNSNFQVCHALIGKENKIFSEAGSPAYRISEPDELKAEIEKILNL